MVFPRSFLCLPTHSPLEIAVADTGIGIARADLLKLFQPFIQLDTSLARRYEGTDLGLVMVKRLAELYGGSVRVQSELGKGSCFVVWLPLGGSHPLPSPLPLAGEG